MWALFAPLVVAGAAGGPVGLILAGIGSVVLSLFGLFRGGVSGAVKSALEGLRDAQAKIADQLTRFAWHIARGLGAIADAVYRLWVRVLSPLLANVIQLLQKVATLIDKVLKPYLQFLKRMTDTILRLYERYVRPVLLVIQKIRQMLAILRLFHIKWAEKLDAELLKLEGYLTKPLLLVLRQLNMLGGWLNIILTAKFLIQAPVWINSIWHYQGALTNTWWASQTRPLSNEDLARRRALEQPVPLSQTIGDFRSAMVRRSGQVHDFTAGDVAALRAGLRS